MEWATAPPSASGVPCRGTRRAIREGVRVVSETAEAREAGQSPALPGRLVAQGRPGGYCVKPQLSAVSTPRPGGRFADRSRLGVGSHAGRVLGPEHPKTLAARGSLARLDRGGGCGRDP